MCTPCVLVTREWAKEIEKSKAGRGKPSLFWALFRMFGLEYCLLGLVLLCEVSLFWALFRMFGLEYCLLGLVLLWEVCLFWALFRMFGLKYCLLGLVLLCEVS